MVTSLPWESFKNFVNTPEGHIVYWSIESEMKCNDPAIPDTDRYWLRIVLNNQHIECLISKVNPRSIEQADWEDNYRSFCIETL